MPTPTQTADRQQVQPLDLSYLFDRLLHYRDYQQPSPVHPDQLGLWLHRRLSVGLFPSLTHLPFKPGSYTRTYIRKELSIRQDKTQAETSATTLFEALVMRWDQQSKTAIHGHPKFSFYHVISGVFEIELFDQTATGSLHPREIQQLTPAKSSWFLGMPGRYDNCIHRVTCLEPGLTFHVYSEDALKGVVFE